MQKPRIFRPAPMMGTGFTRVKNIFLARRNRLRNATSGLTHEERARYAHNGTNGFISRETTHKGQEVKSKTWARHIIANNILSTRRKLSSSRKTMARSQEVVAKHEKELARQRKFGATLPVTSEMTLGEMKLDVPMGKLRLRKRFRPEK